MKRLNQSGSHVVGLVLLILVLGVVGFAGYKVQQAHTKTKTADSTQTVPATITTTSDLQKASQAMDDSSSQLSANLDDSSMDADLNSML